MLPVSGTFDTAGNTTRDAQDRKFPYDAETKQVKVESLSPGTIGEYVYDGDGRRVKDICELRTVKQGL